MKMEAKNGKVVEERRWRIPRLVISILICEAVGLISSVCIITAIPTWYASIQKPAFTPPNWAFGPVWITLYFLMGVTLYLLWNRNQSKTRTIAFYIFSSQLALNFLWAFIFFGLRLYLAGFV